MKQWLAVLAFLLSAPGHSSHGAAGPSVFVLPIQDDITPPLVYLVRRGVKEALNAGADLLVLDMKTNGGQLDVTEEIIQILNQFKGKKVTYVNDRAFSAGTFIAVATDAIYMAPQSVIGAAAPLLMGPGGSIAQIPETVEVKMTSGVRALVRRTAEKHGYNIDVLEAMIDKHKPLVVDGKVLKKEGDILTLTDSEAAKTYGTPPRPLLSSGTIPSLEDLIAELGYGQSKIVKLEPTGMESVGTWLNRISPLLLIIGVIGIYMELKMPGFALPGIVGVVAFALYFLGGYLAGLSGLEWVLVFVVGLALVVFELFCAPGIVLPGLIGAGLIFVSLIMAMVDLYPGGPLLPTIPQLRLPLRNLLIASGGVALLVLALSWWFPKSPFYSRLISQSASGEKTVQAMQRDKDSQVGAIGIAISGLRPSGKAQFGDQILDVITQGELLPKSTKVRIIGHSSTAAIVEEAE